MKTKTWKELTKKQKISGFIIGLTLSFMVIGLFGGLDKDTNTITSETVAPTPTREQEIEKQFSAWDGSHINLTKHIKDSMNNPKSYEHVKTNYWDKKDFLIVTTTFRGENAFGGIVTNVIRAKISLDGQIFEIIE